MLSRPDERGFTMAEAVAAIAVISIIGGLLAVFSSVGLRAIERTRGAATAAANLLEAETTLRDAAALVRIPYWERKPELRFASGKASIPYFRGDPESRLELDWDGRSLLVAEPSVEEPPPDGLRVAQEAKLSVEVLRVGPLLAPSGEARGLLFELAAGGRRCAVAARFGQAPLGMGGR